MVWFLNHLSRYRKCCLNPHSKSLKCESNSSSCPGHTHLYWIACSILLYLINGWMILSYKESFYSSWFPILLPVIELCYTPLCVLTSAWLWLSLLRELYYSSSSWGEVSGKQLMLLTGRSGDDVSHSKSGTAQPLRCWKCHNASWPELVTATSRG